MEIGKLERMIGMNNVDLVRLTAQLKEAAEAAERLQKALIGIEGKVDTKTTYYDETTISTGLTASDIMALESLNHQIRKE